MEVIYGHERKGREPVVYAFETIKTIAEMPVQRNQARGEKRGRSRASLGVLANITSTKPAMSAVESSSGRLAGEIPAYHVDQLRVAHEDLLDLHDIDAGITSPKGGSARHAGLGARATIGRLGRRDRASGLVHNDASLLANKICIVSY